MFGQGDRFKETLANAQPTNASRQANNSRIPAGHYDGGHRAKRAGPQPLQLVRGGVARAAVM